MNWKGPAFAGHTIEILRRINDSHILRLIINLSTTKSHGTKQAAT